MATTLDHDRNVHKVATVLHAAAVVARHDWPKVEDNGHCQRIAANVANLLNALPGDPPAAEAAFRTLDRLYHEMPSGLTIDQSADLR